MDEMKRLNAFGLKFYYRFNPELAPSESDLFDVSPNNIRNLQATANEYVKEHSQEIDQVVHLLLTAHGVAK